MFRVWDRESHLLSEPFTMHWILTGEGEDLMFGPDSSLPIHDFRFYHQDFVWLRFTDVQDRHGNLVFEGDVVQVPYGRGQVVFSAGCFMIQWIDDPEADMELLGMDKRGRSRSNLEVLGNAYECPKLLHQTQ